MISSWTPLVLIGTQLLFSISDLMGRQFMRGSDTFTLANFCSWWFVIYMAIRTVATFGQLWIFAHVELGKTAALFAATSIILANVLGFLWLKEVLSVTGYIGVSLAVVTVLVMTLK